MTYWSNINRILGLFYNNRRLMTEMIKREIFGRYREQFGGLAWSFLNPLIMLGVYTFFFSFVFKARWGEGVRENHLDFALILFAGLITYGFLSECLSRAPQLIITNVNFVKKVVFPLEVLPGIAMGSSLFHACISFSTLLVAQIVLFGSLPWTVIFAPLVLLPLIIMTLGFSWFLSATGVYIRDVSQIIGFILPILLFVSPIFCPASAFPEHFQSFLFLNPLTFVVEEIRNVMIFGLVPHWMSLMIYYVISIIIAVLGLTWFQKTRSGFADVL